MKKTPGETGGSGGLGVLTEAQERALAALDAGISAKQERAEAHRARTAARKAASGRPEALRDRIVRREARMGETRVLMGDLAALRFTRAMAAGAPPERLTAGRVLRRLFGLDGGES